MSTEFSLPLRVYIEDTDAGGTVYSVNYLKFIERARTEFMRSLGFGKNFIFNQNLMFVVTSVQLSYQQPGRLDDELVATARIDSIGGASITLAQSVQRDDVMLVSGQVQIACVDRQSLKPRRLPKEMLGPLQESMNGGDTV